MLKKSIAICLTGLMIASCRHVNPEEDASQKAKAIAVSKQFTQAFLNNKPAEVLSLSTSPFWKDGDPVNTQQIQTWLKENAPATRPETTITEAQFFTLNELFAKVPDLKDKFSDQGFTTENIYAVLLKVTTPDGPMAVILFPKYEKGTWKIAGFED